MDSAPSRLHTRLCALPGPYHVEVGVSGYLSRLATPGLFSCQMPRLRQGGRHHAGLSQPVDQLGLLAGDLQASRA